MIAPQHVREAAELCVSGLEPHVTADWATPVPGLAWNARMTVEHLVDLLGCYTLHLAAGSPRPLHLDVRCHEGVRNGELLAGEALARLFPEAPAHTDPAVTLL